MGRLKNSGGRRGWIDGRISGSSRSAAAAGREDHHKIGDRVEKVCVSGKALAIGADERSEIYVTAAAGAVGASSNKYRADEYVTARRRRLEQLRSECGSEAEFEMKKSREHWTEVGVPRSDDDLLHVANRQLKLADVGEDFYFRLIFYLSFFVEYGGELKVGEKIGEGSQAEIFKAAIYGEDDYVLKLLKPGYDLADLVHQLTFRRSGGFDHTRYDLQHCCYMESATLLRDGRFAFVMRRYWGDLRKLIDREMKDNNGIGPPFPLPQALKIMRRIAGGMRELHRRGILHRDLKASNVLV